jgi:hypothetical protein
VAESPDELRRRKRLRTALVLASIALVFFFGIMLRYLALR